MHRGGSVGYEVFDAWRRARSSPCCANHQPNSTAAHHSRFPRCRAGKPEEWTSTAASLDGERLSLTKRHTRFRGERQEVFLVLAAFKAGVTQSRPNRPATSCCGRKRRVRA